MASSLGGTLPKDFPPWAAVEPDVHDLDAIALQGVGRSIAGIGDEDALLDLPHPILAFPCICGHADLGKGLETSVLSG